MLVFLILGILSLIYMIFLYIKAISVEVTFLDYCTRRKGYEVYCELNKNGKNIIVKFRVMFDNLINNIKKGDKINIYVIGVKDKIYGIGFDKINRQLLFITICSWIMFFIMIIGKNF